VVFTLPFERLTFYFAINRERGTEWIAQRLHGGAWAGLPGRVLEPAGGAGGGLTGCGVRRNLQTAQVPLNPNGTEIRKGIQKMTCQGERSFITSTAAMAR
jgi:hypothetical protein